MELSGHIKKPASIKAAGHLVVHFSGGDCLQKGAKIIASAVSTSPDGSFGSEFFAPWGSDFTICGALEEGPGRPARYYGKATGTFHAEAAGEVTFHDVNIELKQGPPLSFPTLYNPPKPAR